MWELSASEGAGGRSEEERMASVDAEVVGSVVVGGDQTCVLTMLGAHRRGRSSVCVHFGLQHVEGDL